ncbi:zinc finger C4H2 domain-containing protein isoform X1 [Culicoides brevitarsis]|uniref:zinc finger C4H2 domain-containing protein isoform X1 n=1 Tax=Culicoides brevitarsis TaxID=469753 RepID=UPI00307BA3E7
MSVATDERAIYAKLEAMKDIRAKTVQLEKIKLRIVREVENGDAEEKCLAEYRRELELLMQEKMSHVEELRQIHADINAMETVIKQAEESRQRSIQMAQRYHEDFAPLKMEVDTMRRDYLGLDRLPDLHEEEGSIIAPDRFQNYYSSKSSTIPSSSYSRPPLTSHPIASNQENPVQLPPSNAGSGFLPPPGPMRLNKPPEINRLSTQPPSIGMAHPTFRSDFNVNLRQQPPPMKSCLSCHQQIHRNAPICPLCKAKSRSRNPKKPKKKEH